MWQNRDRVPFAVEITSQVMDAHRLIEEQVVKACFVAEMARCPSQRIVLSCFQENLSWLIQQDVGGVKEKLTLKDSLHRGEHDMVLEVPSTNRNFPAGVLTPTSLLIVSCHRVLRSLRDSPRIP